MRKIYQQRRFIKAGLKEAGFECANPKGVLPLQDSSQPQSGQCGILKATIQEAKVAVIPEHHLDLVVKYMFVLVTLLAPKI